LADRITKLIASGTSPVKSAYDYPAELMELSTPEKLPLGATDAAGLSRCGIIQSDHSHGGNRALLAPMRALCAMMAPVSTPVIGSVQVEGTDIENCAEN